MQGFIKEIGSTTGHFWQIYNDDTVVLWGKQDITMEETLSQRAGFWGRGIELVLPTVVQNLFDTSKQSPIVVFNGSASYHSYVYSFGWWVGTDSGNHLKGFVVNAFIGANDSGQRTGTLHYNIVGKTS